MIDVAIVGGGAAGIGAAHVIASAGRSCLIVEASQRIGGRAATVALDGIGALDLGCGWLHSADRNPWVSIADGSGFAIDRAESAWHDQWRDLGFSPDERRAAQAAHAAWSRRLEDDPPHSDRAADALDPDCPWNPWLEALSSYINGARLARLSVADYRAYDRAATALNWRIPAGYGALVAASAPRVPLALSTPVTAVTRKAGGVRLETARGTIVAGACIVTASTAVLASGAIRFDPALDHHLHAASRLPLGLADKLFLAIDGETDLPADGHLIGNPRDAGTGSYYLRPFGRPVIECFFGAAGAESLERAGLAGAAAFAIAELKALLGADIAARLRLVAGSAWRREAHVLGSYSHALPGHAGARTVLAQPAGPILFAGEATHPTDFSTAHGALESGMRAGREALAQIGAAR